MASPLSLNPGVPMLMLKSQKPFIVLLLQVIEGLEAEVLQQKSEAAAQAESATRAAKALAAAEKRLEGAAAETAELQQKIHNLQQQLAPFEGRVQAANADTKVSLHPCAFRGSGAHHIGELQAS